MSTSPLDVAEWMLQEILRDKYIYQDVIATEIDDRFGETFTYIKDNGNIAISEEVLAAFRRLTKDIVVWERGERLWRLREKDDMPSRMQY
jgi:hypothetical protein